MKALLLLLVSSLWVEVVRADDWFWIDAKINGKPVRLVLDTGCDPHLVLFRDTAQRLRLKLQEAKTVSGRWITEESTVKLPWSFWGFARARARLVVLDVPSHLFRGGIHMDGAVGWAILGDRILELDAARQKYQFLRKVPKATATWTRLALRTNLPSGSRVLALDLPNADRSKGVLLVDTGAGGTGVELSPRRWREWKAVHTNQTTLTAIYMPTVGMYAQEQAWADNLSLGPLELTDVLIQEADPIFARSLPDYAGTLGLEALKRLDLIVDGKHGIAYLRPKQTPSAPGEHNRLGAVFVPRDDQSDDLVAHVLDASPAYEGGIRNGDVLLSIGGRDVTSWRTDPGDPFEWAFESPAGTALELTVKRSDLTFKAIVLLREILQSPQGIARRCDKGVGAHENCLTRLNLLGAQ